MSKFINVMILLTACLIPNIVSAAAAPNVMVLPLAVHATEDRSHLRARLSEMIENHLKTSKSENNEKME